MRGASRTASRLLRPLLGQTEVHNWALLSMCHFHEASATIDWGRSPTRHGRAAMERSLRNGELFMTIMFDGAFIGCLQTMCDVFCLLSEPLRVFDDFFIAERVEHVLASWHLDVRQHGVIQFTPRWTWATPRAVVGFCGTTWPLGGGRH